MRLAYLADSGEILISAPARDRLAGEFATHAEKRHGRNLCLLEFPLEAKVVRRMFGRVREFDSLVRLWAHLPVAQTPRSEEHTSELQSLMSTSYAVFWLKKKNK